MSPVYARDYVTPDQVRNDVLFIQDQVRNDGFLHQCLFS